MRPFHAALDRRGFLALAGSFLLTSKSLAKEEREKETIGLGFSLYGMRSLAIPKALKLCHEIGYDCVELPLTPGWPGDSASWTPRRTRQTKRQLADLPLRMSAFMENIKVAFDRAAGGKNIERLKLGFAAAQGLSTSSEPPVIETILGGRPADWEKVKGPMAERLAVWARHAEAAKTVVAIKAHVGGAMHLPEHPVELARKVDSPWLRCAYDYSHFQLRDVEMRSSLEKLLPETVFIHVKDAKGDAKNVRFLLPGEGDTDYVALLRDIWKLGYRGDAHVEVSGQIHGRRDYDPEAAAKKSYQHLSKAFQKADIQRA